MKLMLLEKIIPYKLFTILSLLFILPAAQAQTISLNEAIQLGQQQSLSGKALLNDYQSTQWHYKSVHASLFPQLSFNANIPGYTSAIQPIVQPNGNIIYKRINQGYSTGSLYLQQVVPLTGGTLFVESYLARFDVFGAGKNTTWQASPYIVGFRQPILRANGLKFYYKQEKLLNTLHDKKYVELMEDLAITITQKYFDYYLALLQLKNAQYDAQINDSLYRISKGRFDVGKIAENDLLQSELNFLNAKNSVEQNKLYVLSAEKQLKLILGFSDSYTINLLPPLTIPSFEVDIPTAVSEAINNRSDITALYISELTTQRELKLAAERRRPNFDLTMTYGNTNTAPTLDGVYKNPLSQNSISLGISSPIFGFGKNQYDYKSAHYAFDAQQQRNLYERKKFEIDMTNKVLEFLQLRNSLFISAKADTIAQKRYEVAKNRYLVGKIDITNFSLAQKEKNESLVSYIRTLQNFWSNYYQLRRYTLYDFERKQRIIY